MQKAEFDSKQETVTFMEAGEKTTVQICMNGKEVTKTQEDGSTSTGYVYDWNMWTEADPDRDAIKKNPEDYLDYVPEQAATQEERIKSLEDTVDELLIAQLEA